MLQTGEVGDVDTKLHHLWLMKGVKLVLQQASSAYVNNRLHTLQLSIELSPALSLLKYACER